MSFSCSCDYEPSAVYRASRHVARKEYHCYECHSKIEVGSKYERAFFVYDGYATTAHTCAGCLLIRDWVKINIPCFCFGHGNMIEDARNTVREAAAYAPDETVGLRFGFLRKTVEAKRLAVK